MILNPLWAVAIVCVYSFVVCKRAPRAHLYAPVWRLTCVGFHLPTPPTPFLSLALTAFTPIALGSEVQQRTK